MKKLLSVLMIMALVLTAAPLSGFVGLGCIHSKREQILHFRGA